MAFQITNEWLINLGDDFERRVEDEKLIFWKAGITVIVAAFRLPKDIGKFELLNQVQEKIPEDRLETLVSTKGEIVGLGYTQIQPQEANQERLALTTFTASDTSCVQIAFYLDDPTDLEWAKSIWESLIYHPALE
ncbi:MAG: hypothetical protein ACK2TV_15505 [Anaerolineales bacterium]